MNRYKRLWHRCPKFTCPDILKYTKYFNEPDFKDKLKSIAAMASQAVILPVLRLYGVLKAPTTPKRQKVLIVGALGYFILPFDVIPDMLGPVLGFTDDLAVISIVMKKVAEHVTPEIEEQVQQRYHELMQRLHLDTTA